MSLAGAKMPVGSCSGTDIGRIVGIDRIESGRHAVSLKSSLKPDQEAKARLELRPSGETERVAANVGDGGQTSEE